MGSKGNERGTRIIVPSNELEGSFILSLKSSNMYLCMGHKCVKI